MLTKVIVRGFTEDDALTIERSRLRLLSGGRPERGANHAKNNMARRASRRASPLHDWREGVVDGAADEDAFTIAQPRM